MKKIIVAILILLSTYFTVVSASIIENPIYTFKEGVYKVESLNMPLDELTYLQNISDKDEAYFILFDVNYGLIQSEKLVPSSPKYRIVDLKPSYRIVVVGKGTVELTKE